MGGQIKARSRAGLKHRPQVTDRALGYRAVQVLEYVRLTIEVHGRAPSYGMIANELGFLSKSDVCKVVQRLEKRGLMMRAGSGKVRWGRDWRQIRLA